MNQVEIKSKIKMPKISNDIKNMRVDDIKQNFNPIKKNVSSKARDEMNDLGYYYLNQIAQFVIKNKTRIEKEFAKDVGSKNAIILLSKHAEKFRRDIGAIYETVLNTYSNYTTNAFVPRGFSVRNLPILISANDNFGDLIYVWFLIFVEDKNTVYFSKIFKSEKVSESIKIKSSSNIITEKLNMLYEKEDI